MDDYYDDAEYDDDEYDDAADDWEAEAAEEEQKVKEEEVARKVRAEKKLATRAPVKEEVEAEEAVPENVEHAITDMRQVANDIGSGSALLGGDSEELLGNASIATDEDVDRVGAMIAQRLVSFADTANYDKLIADVFERLTKQMSSPALLTEESDRVHRLREELRRAAKAKPKVVEKVSVQQAGLDLDNFDDKGGAHVAEENEDETGW
ncbi:hypothetical protein ABB37_05496 [Leptomonas pyrrhocoris]|uniref:Eukaryotic translation initiation factor 3 30 kDa subunit n=1 Tax=Leptomonas pyrrhocoris TaxID=157538 RepID=A0A0N0DV14_LEPPY|nr:hypothetical protein ABB37_05496 [Leptomonas pyrrhocoris]KPA79738.1 hypothetical protein ABB37_05496 [Leptomonas pyrrhocoris]|eukprot:XP_015658177.1 hypothetical protein ABB37_05496 [Leptomonas pyrrhocoris]